MSNPKKHSTSFGKHLLDFVIHPRARAVALLFLAHGLMISTWVAQIPLVKTKLELNDSELGNVLLGLPLGVIIMNSIAGWLLDRIGVWRSVILSFSFYSILILFVLSAQSYWSLFFSLLVTGWSIGLLIVSSNTLAARVEKAEGIFIMSTCHASFSLGAMLGASVSSLAIAQSFPVMNQMGITIGLFLLFIILHKKHFESIQTDESAADGISFGLPNKELLLLIIIGLAFAFGEGLVVDWSAVYLRDEVGTPEEMAALGYGACALMMMVIRLGGDILVPRFGNKKLLIAGGIIAFLGIMLMVLIQHPIVGIIGFGILGVGIGLGIPLLINLAARTKGFSDGAGVGIFATFAFVGFIIEPPLVGWISEQSSLELGLSVVAIICLVGGLLSFKIDDKIGNN